MTTYNAGANSGRIRVDDQDAHDEAMHKLSPGFKEWLIHYDIGGYSGVQLLELVEKFGEHQTKMIITIDRNVKTYEMYGPSHPNFNPRLPFKRTK